MSAIVALVSAAGGYSLRDASAMSVMRSDIVTNPAFRPQPWLGPTIPRILHQTYGSATLPHALSNNVALLKKQNPGWEYRFYDDLAIEDFISRVYGNGMLQYYHRIDPLYGAARADLFRYLLIYHFGGIYLDIKSRFRQPIDEVLDGEEGFVVSYWSNGLNERYEGYGMHPELTDLPRGEIQQWHIIAAPGHPFLKAVIDHVLTGIDVYRPWRDLTGKHAVLRLTGPIGYTRAIAPLLDRYLCRVLTNEQEVSLEYSIVEGDTHHGLFKHHYSRSRASVIRQQGIYRVIELLWRVARLAKQCLLGR